MSQPEFYTTDYSQSGFQGYSQPSNFSQPNTSYSHPHRKINVWTGRFEDEAPLLEELGINFTHIMKRTYLVLHPLKGEANEAVMRDVDLAGPLVFCLLFGFFLLMTGKVHFGYIYGMGVIGCVSMWFLLNLMGSSGIEIDKTASILGYCLLPIVILAGIGIFFPLNGIIGHIVTFAAILWCSRSASVMYVTAMGLHDQMILVMYPAALVYACFALLALF